jgi:hypothetical protein
MAELKTQKTGASVDDFLATVQDPERRRDARVVLELMRRVTGEAPAMWGASIVGFGEYHFRHASGREGDWLVTGFSPRARGLTLYLMAGFDRLRPLLERLGRHTTTVSCLTLRRLADVDAAVLEAIVRQGVAEARALHRPAESAQATSPAKKTGAKTAAKEAVKVSAVAKKKAIKETARERKKRAVGAARRALRARRPP